MENRDLEEYTPKPTKIRAVIHYISGRTEELYGTLNKQGIPNKTFTKKINALSNFPTVRKIEQQKL